MCGGLVQSRLSPSFHSIHSSLSLQAPSPLSSLPPATRTCVAGLCSPGSSPSLLPSIPSIHLCKPACPVPDTQQPTSLPLPSSLSLLIPPHPPRTVSFLPGGREAGREPRIYEGAGHGRIQSHRATWATAPGLGHSGLGRLAALTRRLRRPGRRSIGTRTTGSPGPGRGSGLSVRPCHGDPADFVRIRSPPRGGSAPNR